MPGPSATLAAVDVFLAYISVVIFFLSVSLLFFCYWRYSGKVKRCLMPRNSDLRCWRLLLRLTILSIVLVAVPSGGKWHFWVAETLRFVWTICMSKQ
jgi:hypothetical protein